MQSAKHLGNSRSTGAIRPNATTKITNTTVNIRLQVNCNKHATYKHSCKLLNTQKHTATTLR
jgi:hypothetical protein